MADSVAKQACSENTHLSGVTYTSICERIKHVVKDPHIQYEKKPLRFIARTAPPENTRYEAEETRIYWQNSLLESTNDYALTKVS